MKKMLPTILTVAALGCALAYVLWPGPAQVRTRGMSPQIVSEPASPTLEEPEVEESPDMVSHPLFDDPGNDPWKLPDELRVVPKAQARRDLERITAEAKTSGRRMPTKVELEATAVKYLGFYKKVLKRRDPQELLEQARNDLGVRFRHGELIVMFREDVSLWEGLRAVREVFPKRNYRYVRSSSNLGPHLLQAESGASRKNSREATLADLKRVLTLPLVLAAELNSLQHAMLAPGEIDYAKQRHHYGAIGLEAAWGITTGNASDPVTVAIIDSGHAPQHPDLDANTARTPAMAVDGYDFYSNPTTSGDGDGRDGDPTDTRFERIVNGNAESQASHGTHVAGTVGAEANNGTGGVGVCWSVRLMPVRVLSNFREPGGAMDISDGIKWASGQSVAGVPAPSRSAEILNLSLGGPVANMMQEAALDMAVASGVVAVAAAGNDNTPAPGFPASYPSVISVAATGPGNVKASYSNFGPFIDIAAPGGEGLGADGVYSTNLGNRNYAQISGTSMACPHVAGVIALMLSVNRSLTPATVRQILHETATDQGVAGRDDVFGHGLINAAAAVAVAAGQAVSPDPVLSTTPAELGFSLDNTTATLAVSNLGQADAAVQQALVFIEQNGAFTQPSGQSWLTVSTTNATAIGFSGSSVGAPAQVAVTVDPALVNDGLHEGAVVLDFGIGSSGVFVVPVSFTKSTPPDPGVVTVKLLDLDNGGAVVATTTTSLANQLEYDFPDVVPGNYRVEAFADLDGDGNPDTRIDELSGAAPTDGGQVTVNPGVSVAGVDVAMNSGLERLPQAGLYSDGARAGMIGVMGIDRQTNRPVEFFEATVSGGVTAPVTADAYGRAFVSVPSTNPIMVTLTHPEYQTESVVAFEGRALVIPMTAISSARLVRVELRIAGLDPNVDRRGVVLSDTGGASDFLVQSSEARVRLTLPARLPESAVATMVIYDANGAMTRFGIASLSGLSLASNGFENRDVSIVLPNPQMPQVAQLTIPVTLGAPPANFSTPSSLFAESLLSDGASNGILGFNAVAPGQSLALTRAVAPLGPESKSFGRISAGMFDTAGRISIATVHGRLDRLPTNFNRSLLSPPSGDSPFAEAVLSTATPTFLMTPNPQASLTSLSIQSICGDWAWNITAPSSASSITLPVLAQGGLPINRPLAWAVTDSVVQQPQSFDFQNARTLALLQQITDQMRSAPRLFRIGAPSGLSARNAAPETFCEASAASATIRRRCLTYVVGGTAANGDSRPRLHIYDPVVDSWALGPAPPTARTRANLEAIGDKLVLLGGAVGSTVTGLFPSLDEAVYDVASQTWSVRDVTPGTGPLTPRYAAVSFQADDTVYLVGGRNSSNDILQTVEAFLLGDPVTQSAWINMTSFVPALPSSRSESAAVKVGSKVYLIGGVEGGFFFDDETSIVLMLDTSVAPGSRQWVTVSPMPAARARHSAVLLPNGKVYVFGGVDINGDPTSTIFEYNPTTDQWQTFSSTMSPARYGIAVTAADGKAFLFGGADASFLYSSTRSWDPGF